MFGAALPTLFGLHSIPRMYALETPTTGLSFEAFIHPYRSLGPAGHRLLLGAVVAANALAAAVMLWLGAWPVLGFLGLDILAVYYALRASHAQARACERVAIDGDTLVVERVDAKGHRRAWHFPSYWVSVSFDDEADERGTVTLRSHGRALVIGECLAPGERKSFADALRQALREAKTSAALA